MYHPNIRDWLHCIFPIAVLYCSTPYTLSSDKAFSVLYLFILSYAVLHVVWFFLSLISYYPLFIICMLNFTIICEIELLWFLRGFDFFTLMVWVLSFINKYYNKWWNFFSHIVSIWFSFVYYWASGSVHIAGGQWISILLKDPFSFYYSVWSYMSTDHNI